MKLIENRIFYRRIRTARTVIRTAIRASTEKASGKTINLYSKFVIVFVVILLSACTVPPKKKAPPYWPKAPDLPRFIFETSLRSESSVIRLTTQQKFRDIVSGVNKKELIAYEKPYDIAARNGRVVVSDTMGNSLVLFDLVNNRLLRIGHLKYGRLVDPLGVAMDYLLKIYVADSTAKSVKIYDEVGYFLGSVGDSTTLVKPIDVAVNPTGDRIYVVDSGGIASIDHRVVVFDREGNVITTIGTRGGADGNFNLPRSAAVAPDGTLYVLDGGNFRVQAFDRDGKFLRKWGKPGRGLGQFSRPRGIAVDDDGNIYVTDAGFRNFQIFNPQGQLLMWIGGSSMFDVPGEYAMPAGIAVDETNRIYIVDQLHRKIEVIRRLSEAEGKRILADALKAAPTPVKVLPAVPFKVSPVKVTTDKVIESPKKIISEEPNKQSAETSAEQSPKQPPKQQVSPVGVSDETTSTVPKKTSSEKPLKEKISPAESSDTHVNEQVNESAKKIILEEPNKQSTGTPAEQSPTQPASPVSVDEETTTGTVPEKTSSEKPLKEKTSPAESSDTHVNEKVNEKVNEPAKKIILKEPSKQSTETPPGQSPKQQTSPVSTGGDKTTSTLPEKTSSEELIKEEALPAESSDNVTDEQLEEKNEN